MILKSKNQLWLLVCLCSLLSSNLIAQAEPNILLIIADDLGTDALSGYLDGQSTKPITPHIDSLRGAGVTYTNTWATPQCAPTRSAIMSGKYGIKNGVREVPGNLDLIHESIFTKIGEATNEAYAGAVIGKWHIANPQTIQHVYDHGINHFEGILGGGVQNYYDWEKVNADGSTSDITDYATTEFTNDAIDWIDDQTQPWFLWLAHIAPHSPWHDPPATHYTTNPTNPQRQYLAAIEALDFEIGRLFDSMDQATRENTLVIFVGDNGTPGARLQHFPTGHGKGSVYQGGLNAPMIVSGHGVSRIGEIEDAMTHVSDIYATLLEVAGMDLNGGIHNSLSIASSFTTSNTIDRTYNYSDYLDNGIEYWAIRNEQYKLIENENGDQEFYDLSIDPTELNNLINNLNTDQMIILADLENEAAVRRIGWSTNDGIQNGNETDIDVVNDNCPNGNTLSFENIGCCESPTEPSVFYEYVESGERKLYNNNFPNHDFCHSNNNVMEEQFKIYSIPLNPTLSNSTTSVLSDNGRPARFFGVALNGVKFAPAPASPFIFENTDTGEFNWDWVFEPTNVQGAGMDLVSLDCASAHVGPQGYHYHGNMFEYVDNIQSGISTTDTPPSEPLHIGWASDGFPIVYRFGPDENGSMKELTSGWQIRQGNRPGDGISAPCGPYNGRYTADYEHIASSGDLDECNGIQRDITLTTSQGTETFSYFYVITSDFPQVSRCLSGTASLDFESDAAQLTGVDADNDGFTTDIDCDDTDASINPLATEIIGNDVDENCDGLLTTSNRYVTPSELGITISPNPSKDAVHFSCNTSCLMTINIVAVDGKTISSKSGNNIIRFPNLPTGIYVAHITLDNLHQTTSKITIQ